MALKFLNKKGWHTGSLRNIENVWKAEQKHEAEQKKLEELRKQIQDEREKNEFRLLQEQAGLAPRQERLDFLYESGLAVGKSSEGSGFKALQAPPTAAAAAPAASSGATAASSKAAVPGALFEDKPQTANDAWRKLHSDPLFLIRQREQEALNRIKNNPIQMAMIKKSAEAEKKTKKEKKEKHDKKKHKKKHYDDDSYDGKHSSRIRSDQEDTVEDDQRKKGYPASENRHHMKSKDDRRSRSHPEYRSEDEDRRKHHLTSERHDDRKSSHDKKSIRDLSDASDSDDVEKDRRRSKHGYHGHRFSKDDNHPSRVDSDSERRSGHGREKRSHHSLSHQSRNTRQDLSEHYVDRSLSRDLNEKRRNRQSASEHNHDPTSEMTRDQKRDDRENKKQDDRHNNRRGAPKLSKEERAARLREMQMNAELHEEERWKRLKHAAEDDAQEAARSSFSKGKNFLDDAQKSIYGTEKGGSSTIEESVRRRAYYSRGSTAATESNAFRR